MIHSSIYDASLLYPKFQSCHAFRYFPALHFAYGDISRNFWRNSIKYTFPFQSQMYRYMNPLFHDRDAYIQVC